MEAHLTIVFATLAASRWIEDRTGWLVRKFVRIARRHTTKIQVGARIITAAVRCALDLIHGRPVSIVQRS